MVKAPLLVLSLAVMAAQQPIRPDFSGRWVLERVQPIEIVLPVGRVPKAMTVDQRVSETPMNPPTGIFLEQVTVDREFETGVEARTYRLGIAGGFVGGGPAGLAQPPTRTWVSAMWRRDRLEIREGTSAGPPSAPEVYTEHAEDWSLDANGRLAIVLTDRASGQGDVIRTLTYRRP